MHPILASPARLLLYLLAWIPVGALLCLVARGSGGMSWRDTAVVVTPACLVFAFACLSPFYTCRAQLAAGKLSLPGLPGMALAYAMAAAAGGLLLVGITRVTASALQKAAPAWPPLFGLGMLVYLLSVGSHLAGLAVDASHRAERRAAEAQTLAREAELQALRIQLNPHFLFNSLHSISALATQDGARARQMCVLLADFLRGSLRLGALESIALRDELALARNYLEVERVRFSERLRVETELEPGCEDCLVPALLLQPLVENAVKHGIAGLVEGGAIRLAARRSGSDVTITLENPFDPETPARRNLGLGLAHVEKRLRARYGSGARFDAGARDSVYRVVLRLPCESPMASNSRA